MRIHQTLALLGTLAITPVAFAQDALSFGTSTGKNFAVVGGVALAEPTENTWIGDESRLELDGSNAATLSASWYVNDHIAVEAWGAASKFGHRVNGADGKAGSVDAQPYALSAQYHFRPADSLLRPFVGLGYYEQNFDSETVEPTGALTGQRLGVETAKGAMATAGVDVALSPSWFARADARYLSGDSDLYLDGETVGKAKVNPVVLGVGIGARF
ncbi:OmpW/AlkL family protein [Marilutibacter alkalisoli]|uniref:Outer membrane beta-barrel protein n=1 Tax=Marilutibacter alkalisoli TaxID=2591633 RepID=A0A514BNP5_9GAMM|nr:OmpW family outer membrane protein [Lysobacter alkalisoli]QDH69003.1 outer membrane beta-barrel protein [Lysobacter alkalisoli]